MKRILVTGATGFIGRHLLPALQSQHWSVTAAVRSNPDPPWTSTTVQVGEINDQTNWQTALQGVDTVIHLAARAHILQETSVNPDAEFFRINAAGTANLVHQSIQAGVQHFLLMSSVGAMASFSAAKLKECDPCLPDTPYGRSKWHAEQALMTLTQNSPMSWTILRPPLVYGSGNPGNMQSLIALVRRGIPLPFGSIQNLRSFIYVGNLVDAIITSLRHPGAVNRCFLVSDGQDISTPELIRQIAHQLQRSSVLWPCPLIVLQCLGWCGSMLKHLGMATLPVNLDSVNRLTAPLVVDSSLIRQTLHWSPPYRFDQGIAHTLER